eukprot:TRINITY_DN164_c0_g2_i1.p1 TRINITY_DN164_c0_g2~~TRINITY_DN164_c0_g2_i1.p1  ORF type:complete len:765 (+),score=325.04 TRINITY_DN164_c0_g2_i1:30-2297(+)
MDPAASDLILDESWPLLKEGITSLFSFNGKGMSRKDYMSYYSIAYNYIFKLDDSSNNRLYTKISDLVTDYATSVKEELQSLPREILISRYEEKWSRYQASSKTLHNLCSQMNKDIEGKKEAGRSVVSKLCMLIWRDNVLVKLEEPIGSALISLIEDERNGLQVDSFMISSVIKSLEMNGVVDDVYKEPLILYQKIYETEFLKSTENYYSAESNKYLHELSYSIPDYLIKAEIRLLEEEKRSKNYMSSSTSDSLIKLVEKELVATPKEQIQADFAKLLQDERLEDLKRMYGALVRIHEGLEPLRKDFEAYVEKMGLLAIEKIVSTFEKDPRQYTETLISVHQKFFGMVEDIFKSDSGFHSSLDKACRRFVNKNAISTQTQKSPELLAKYSNVLLTKGRQFSEEQAEQKLSELLQLFKYIEDKDVFVTFYSHCFAKRSINDTSIVESEGSLISKLKGAYGVEYVSKLQKMYSDILVNNGNKDAFKTYCESNNKILSVDCCARVLTVGSWPLKKPSENFTFSVPSELVDPLRVFEEWYKSQKAGIELCWLHQFSRSELRFNVRSNDAYTFILGDDFLLAILLKMNSSESVTIGKLIETTHLQPSNFDQSLKTLLKSKILLCNNSEFDEKAPLDANAVITINKKFSNKRKRLNVNSTSAGKERTASKSDAAGGPSTAGGIKDMENVDEQRKLSIQAAIVRIMKTRKELSHTNLTQETFTQLKNLFSPQPRMVKQCIQLLIEKDYLERKPDANDIYLYKA